VALRKNGQHQEARDVLETALKRTNAMIAYLRLADLLMAQGDFDQAETLLRKGMVAHDERAEFHDALGRLWYKANRYAEAVEAFAEALRLNPTMTESRLSHGRALLGAGRREEAKSAIAQAIKMRPAWEEALLLLGELALESSELAEADALAKRALNANERSPATRDFLARVALRRAADALAAAQDTEAEAIYREALSRVPEHGPLHGALGTLLGRQRRLSEAQEEFQRFADLSPDDARAWFLLGTVLEQRGEKERAIEAFKRGLDVARATGDNRRAPLIEQALARLRS
jgi:tetratricopeptide (TPR) repeat protein